MTGSPSVLVIGAGLSGLSAARLLTRAGKRTVVLEASSVAGGRLRSHEVAGFTLDTGYAVLFPAYPAVKRQLDLAALDLVPLLPGAALRSGRREWLLGSVGDCGGFAASLTSDRLTLGDRLRLARLGAELYAQAPHELLRGSDQSTLSFLRGYGFSEAFIRHFFQPFFGGIFLRRDLSTSARLFRYYLRMLLEGGAALPRKGMGEVAAQLARGLDVRYGVRVQGLRPEGAATRVITSAGEYRAPWVIVAADPPSIGRLCGLSPLPGVASTYLYYAAPRPSEPQPRLLLNTRAGLINNAHWLSLAIPERAAGEKALLVVSVLGELAPPDTELDQAVRAELASWYGDVSALETLCIERIPYAQFAQPPGFERALWGHATPLPQVLIASEATSMSGIQGALESGEKAAAIILNDLGALSRPRGA